MLFGGLGKAQFSMKRAAGTGGGHSFCCLGKLKLSPWSFAGHIEMKTVQFFLQGGIIPAKKLARQSYDRREWVGAGVVKRGGL